MVCRARKAARRVPPRVAGPGPDSPSSPRPAWTPRAVRGAGGDGAGVTRTRRCRRVFAGNESMGRDRGRRRHPPHSLHPPSRLCSPQSTPRSRAGRGASGRTTPRRRGERAARRDGRRVSCGKETTSAKARAALVKAAARRSASDTRERGGGTRGSKSPTPPGRGPEADAARRRGRPRPDARPPPGPLFPGDKPGSSRSGGAGRRPMAARGGGWRGRRGAAPGVTAGGHPTRARVSEGNPALAGAPATPPPLSLSQSPRRPASPAPSPPRPDPRSGRRARPTIAARAAAAAFSRWTPPELAACRPTSPTRSLARSSRAGGDRPCLRALATGADQPRPGGTRRARAPPWTTAGSTRWCQGG